jgi:hypothetical protein
MQIPYAIIIQMALFFNLLVLMNQPPTSPQPFHGRKEKYTSTPIIFVKNHPPLSLHHEVFTETFYFVSAPGTVDKTPRISFLRLELSAETWRIC